MARRPYALSTLVRRPDRVGSTVRLSPARNDAQYEGESERAPNAGAASAQAPSGNQRIQRTRRSVTPSSSVPAATDERATSAHACPSLTPAPVPGYPTVRRGWYARCSKTV